MKLDAHFFHAVKNSDLDDNGGILDISPILNNKKNNLLIDVTPDEVSQGLIRYRKLFLIPQRELPFLKIYLSQPSTGTNNLLIHSGTPTDTQEDAENYISWKGSGLIYTALLAGDITSIVVQSKNEGEGFNPFDIIRLSDDTNEDFIRINAVSWNGNIATLTCIPNSYINYNYPVVSYISACIEKGVCSITPIWVKEIIPEDIFYYRSSINRLKCLF